MRNLSELGWIKDRKYYLGNRLAMGIVKETGGMTFLVLSLYLPSRVLKYVFKPGACYPLSAALLLLVVDDEDINELGFDALIIATIR